VRLYPGLGWKDTAAHDENRTDGRNKSLFTRLNHIRGLRFYREWLVKTKVEAIQIISKNGIVETHDYV